MISKVLTNKIFSSIEEFYIQKGVQPLGIGSFGTVRMGLHKYSNKKYAIKIICIDNNFTQSQCSLLERQIQIHFGLNHPHIIKLWDVIQDKQKIYLIMEYAPNGNMFNFQAKQKKLSQMDSFKIFYQTLQAIDYIHDNDIFHRDIKPQNILIDHQMNVKICDFGWAAPNIHRKRTTFCGTYEYMAPQMINQESYDYKIDIWALGVLLFQLLHNNAPFQAQSLQEMKTQVSKGSYQINVSIPKQLKNLIISILQFDPKDRPQLSDVKQHAWVQKMKRHLQQNIILQKSQKKKSIKNAHGSMQALPKKCVSKFSSLLFSQQEYNKGNAICKVTNDIKKFKKKCKTLQQESLQKIVKPIKHLFTLNTEKQNDNGIPYQNIHSPKKYQINKLQFSKTQSQKMFMQNNFIKKTLKNVEKNQKPGIIISQRNAVECKKKGKKIF